jgi:hypothetical protein
MTALQTNNAMIAHVFEQAQIYQLDVALAAKANVSALGTAASHPATDFAPAGSYQPLDATLTALAALVTQADKIAVFTGTDAVSTATLTAYARTLTAAIDAASARLVLGIDSAAVHPATDFALASNWPNTGILTAPISQQPSGSAVHGNSGSGVKQFAYTDGNVHTITNTAAHTWNLTSWPVDGVYAEMMIVCKNAGANAITFPTIRWLKGDGGYTLNFSDLNINLPVSGLNWFMFMTIDGGTTVYGRVM